MYKRDMEKITAFTFSYTSVSKNLEMRNLSGRIGFNIVTFYWIFEPEISSSKFNGNTIPVPKNMSLEENVKYRKILRLLSDFFAIPFELKRFVEICNIFKQFI